MRGGKPYFCIHAEEFAKEFVKDKTPGAEWKGIAEIFYFFRK